MPEPDSPALSKASPGHVERRMSISLNIFTLSPSSGLSEGGSATNPPLGEIFRTSAETNTLREYDPIPALTPPSMLTTEQAMILRYTAIPAALRRLIGIERTQH